MLKSFYQCGTQEVDGVTLPLYKAETTIYQCGAEPLHEVQFHRYISDPAVAISHQLIEMRKNRSKIGAVGRAYRPPYRTVSAITIPPEVIELSKKTWKVGGRLIYLSNKIEEWHLTWAKSFAIREFSDLPVPIQRKHEKALGLPLNSHYRYTIDVERPAIERIVETEKVKLLNMSQSEMRRLDSDFKETQLSIIPLLKEHPELMQISDISTWEVYACFPSVEPFVVINGDCIDVQVLEDYDRKVALAVLNSRYPTVLCELINGYLE